MFSLNPSSNSLARNDLNSFTDMKEASMISLSSSLRESLRMVTFPEASTCCNFTLVFLLMIALFSLP